MKLLIGLFFVSCIGLTYGQDTTKTTPKLQEKQVENKEGPSFPSVSFRRADDVARAPQIKGNYIIERYVLQINSSDAKEAMKVVGNPLVIDETTILGEEMDSIKYDIYESQMMNTEDYLFRIFGEVPSTLPDDLPTSILVHKTDNLDCYGIAELNNGLVLIPYNGLLLYLRRY